MALNIYEELDLSASGDDIPEGFLKVKNNWEAWDTELNNARDGKASLIAKFDSLPSIVGHIHRSQFTYVDGDTITVGGGAYDVNGTLAKITSSITTTAHGVTGADWAYLYIDYSSIPSDGVLLQSDLIWSTTEPAWSHSLLGWYNGNDRCIFACRIAVTSDDILNFYHDSSLIHLDDAITVDSGNTPEDFTDISSAFTLPSFCRKVLTSIEYTYNDSSGIFAWRVNGSSSSAGHRVGTAQLSPAYLFNQAQVDVITDSGHLIEIRDNVAGSNTYSIYENGWYLPEGM